jgi:hypothetical protein
VKPTKKKTYKATFTDQGSALPDDPLFKEGWKIGVPLSSLSWLIDAPEVAPELDEEPTEASSPMKKGSETNITRRS